MADYSLWEHQMSMSMMHWNMFTNDYRTTIDNPPMLEHRLRLDSNQVISVHGNRMHAPTVDRHRRPVRHRL